MASHTTTILLLLTLFYTASGVPVDTIEATAKMDENLPDPYHVDLASSKECSLDVERICGKALMKTNFDVINCLQNSYKDYDISDRCQNLVWNYKRNVTTDAKYESAVKSICGTMIQKVPECQGLDQTRGHLIACLVDHLGDSGIQPLATHCESFLRRLEVVVFADYRIIYKFTDACQGDIDRLHCGRVNEGGDNQVPYHSQGMVLSCLATKLQDLNDKCRFEMLRVSELQGSDYHFDRQLFFACRNDRERFCRDIPSGEGRVYRCLISHKMHPEMSQQCQDKLLVHQLLEQEDYKVNFKFAKACQEDIGKNNCNKEVSSVAGFVRAKMSVVILCLESVVHEGGSVGGECRGEMKEVRRGLMEDYRVSPQLVVACSHEIKDKCGGGLRKDGGTIHCLMGLAQPTNDGQGHVKGALSSTCLVAVRELLLEADVASDMDVDPYLHHTCDHVARTYCSDLTNDNDAYSCLFDSIDKPQMTEECRSSLYQLEYFKNRDFRLDPELYSACRVDAREICYASPEWHVKGKEEGGEENLHILSCLYNHSWKTSSEKGYKPISRQCSSHVRRVMKERALSVNLIPEVEEKCLLDLSKFCLAKTGKEEEMECLSENWEGLSGDCKAVIGDYITNVDKDPGLNEIFLRWCEPLWDARCRHVVDTLSLEHVEEMGVGVDLMRCLVENKGHELMDHRCLAGVEHHQLMVMKDIKFSHRLYQACEANIKKYCHDVTDKGEVVLCLSGVRLNDTLLEKEDRLSESCLVELTTALSERSENLNLDPELLGACEADLDKFCQHISLDMGEMHECLEMNMDKLGRKCKKVLFQRIRTEALDPKTDFYFYSNCKGMIEKHCPHSLHSPDTIFSCLYHKRDEDDFDGKCRSIVVSRAHLFGMDFTLNNDLRLACKDDVDKFCMKERKYAEDADEHEGMVIRCLRSVFSRKAKGEGGGGGLSDKCEVHIREVIMMSAENSMVDFSLGMLCSREISDHCRGVIEGGDGVQNPKKHNFREDKGRVVECLKEKLNQGIITEQTNKECYGTLSRLLHESLVDIHADAKLHRMCSSDLKGYCEEVPKGDGKQLECLLSIYNNARLAAMMKEACRDVLKSRISLWRVAAPEAELPKSLQEVVGMISSSPSSNYLFLLILILISIIFVMGLCLGRLSNRLRREMKLR